MGFPDGYRGYQLYLIGARVILAVIIFSVSLPYFLGLRTVSLVPESQCSGCTTCEASYQLNEQSSFHELPLSVWVMADGSKTTNDDGGIHTTFQHVNFWASWTACGKSSYKEMTLKKKIYSSIDVANFPFNVDGVTKWDQPGTERKDDDLHAINYNNMKVTIKGHATDDNDECFELTCGAEDYFNATYTSGIYFSVMQVQRTDYQDVIKIDSAINVDTKTAVGSCVGVVYGVPLTYFTISASVDKSTDYLCKTDNSAYSALASSFANTLAADGFVKNAVTTLMNLIFQE